MLRKIFKKPIKQIQKYTQLRSFSIITSTKPQPTTPFQAPRFTAPQLARFFSSPPPNEQESVSQPPTGPASSDNEYLQVIEAVKNTSKQELENGILSLNSLSMISLAVAHIAQAPFNVMVKNVRLMRRTVMHDDFEKYEELSAITHQQYDQVWIEHLAAVLNDVEVTFDNWREGLVAQDLSSPEVRFMVIPLEIMNRSVPLDVPVENFSVELAREMTQFQIDEFKAKVDEFKGNIKDYNNLFTLMGSWLADVGYEKFGMYEEHLTAIEGIGEDEELRQLTKELQDLFQTILPQGPPQGGAGNDGQEGN
jgi:hypothetical protein